MAVLNCVVLKGKLFCVKKIKKLDYSTAVSWILLISSLPYRVVTVLYKTFVYNNYILIALHAIFCFCLIYAALLLYNTLLKCPIIFKMNWLHFLVLVIHDIEHQPEFDFYTLIKIWFSYSIHKLSTLLQCLSWPYTLRILTTNNMIW